MEGAKVYVQDARHLVKLPLHASITVMVDLYSVFLSGDPGSGVLSKLLWAAAATRHRSTRMDQAGWIELPGRWRCKAGRRMSSRQARQLRQFALDMAFMKPPFRLTGGRLQYGGWNAAIPECGPAKQWLPSRALSEVFFWSTRQLHGASQDMTTLDHLHEPALLHNLRRRFFSQVGPRKLRQESASAVDAS